MCRASIEFALKLAVLKRVAVIDHQARHTLSRDVFLLVLLLLSGSERVFAANCGPVLLNEHFSVRSGVAASRTVTPQFTGALEIIATESNVDLRLEVRGLDDRIIGSADSPIRRFGSQRLIVDASAGQPLTVALVVTEPAPAAGRSDVVVRRACPTRSVRAEADSAYARYKARAYDAAPANAVASGSDRDRAILGYRQCAARPPSKLDEADVAECSLALASALYQDSNDWADALREARRSAMLYRAQTHRYGELRANAIAAAAAMEVASGAPTDSNESFQRIRGELDLLARAHAKRGEFYDAALNLNNIGLSDFYQGRFEAAVAAFARVRPRYQALGDHIREAQVLQNWGLADWGRGDLAAARARLRQALILHPDNVQPRFRAILLNNAALASFAVGRLDESLHLHSESLALSARSGWQREQAYSLYGLGVTYRALGSRALAESFLRQSLAIRTAALDARGRVATLRALAHLQDENGSLAEALRFAREALSLAVAPPTRLRIDVHVASLERRLRIAARTRLRLEAKWRSLPMADVTDRAVVLIELARDALDAGEFERARRFATFATQGFASGHLLRDEFDSRLVWADAAMALRRQKEANAVLDQALDLSDILRAQTANLEYRASTMEPLRIAFDRKLSWLRAAYVDARLHHNAPVAQMTATRALNLAERARARVWGELARADTSVGAAAPSAASDVSFDALAGLLYQYEARIDRVGVRDARAQILSGQVALLANRLSDALHVRGVGIGRGARERQGSELFRVPAQAVVVEYWVGAERTWAWVLASGSTEWLDVGDSAAVATSLVDLYRRASNYSVATSDGLAPLAKARSLLIDPMAPALRHARRLVVIADGAMNWVPFAMLLGAPEGGSGPALPANLAVVWVPGLSVARDSSAQRSPLPAPHLLLVADPIYGSDDPRIVAKRRPAATPGDADYPRLAGTAWEAAQVRAALQPSDSRMLVAGDANRSEVLRGLEGDYRWLHLASHAVQSTTSPLLSSLVLSRFSVSGDALSPYVYAADLAAVKMHATLVTLSACSTAVGPSYLGEGMLSLQNVLLARGAQHVLATLWPVPDHPAAEFMARFYHELAVGGRSPADTLSVVQREWVQHYGAESYAVWGAWTIAARTLS